MLLCVCVFFFVLYFFFSSFDWNIAVSSRPVSLILKEELTLSMSREGAINNMEIKGTLSLMVNDSDFGQIQIGTDISGSKGFQLQVAFYFTLEF